MSGRPADDAVSRRALLGQRLRELRRAAGLSQAEVARRMGYRDRGGKSAVSRLERGAAARAGLDLVRRYLKAAGAGLADIADLVGQGVRTEEGGTRKEEGSRKKPVKTAAERLRAVERRARRLYIARLFEGMQYDLFTSGALAVDEEERAALARHAREVFRLIEKHEYALARRRKVARVAPDKVALVEKYARVVFDQMWRAGDFERRPEVDAAGVVAGKVRLTRVWRVEDRLHREEEQRFLAWGRERNKVFQRIWGEGMDLLRQRGIRGQRLARLSSVIAELCGVAAETGPGSKPRKSRQRELARRLRDPELARQMCELVFRRWDELKHTVPPLPDDEPAGKRA